MEEEEEIYENETDGLIADLLGYFKKENRRLLLEHCRYDDQWNWQILPYSEVCKKIVELLKNREEEGDDVLTYFEFRNKYENIICKNDVGAGYTHLIEMIRWYNNLRGISDLSTTELLVLKEGVESSIVLCEQLEKELQ